MRTTKISLICTCLALAVAMATAAWALMRPVQTVEIAAPVQEPAAGNAGIMTLDCPEDHEGELRPVDDLLHGGII